MQSNRLFYLVGSNIKTSLSPILHNKLFELKRKQGYQYLLYEENILPNLDQLSNVNNYGGMSITIPFKRAYQEQIHKIQKSILQYEGKFACKAKIINTVVKIDDFLFQGYNTDLFGIQKTLYSARNIANVVILGAGATSQTFCEYFQNHARCTSIFMLNRSEEKVVQLSKKYSKVKMLGEYQNEKIGFLVNTLPSQIINSNSDEYRRVIKNLFFTSEVGFMDVNYRNRQRILQAMIEGKCTRLECFQGLDMLIWQAIEQNRLFCQDGPEQSSIHSEYYHILKDEVYKNQIKK